MGVGRADSGSFDGAVIFTGYKTEEGSSMRTPGTRRRLTIHRGGPRRAGAALLSVLVAAATAVGLGIAPAAAVTWDPAVDLSAAGGFAQLPQVASSADGTKLTVVWVRSNGTNNIVQSRTSTDSGATWGDPVDLSAAGASASSPQVVSSADGTRLTAAWLRTNAVHARTSTDGGATWGDRVDLSEAGVVSSYPQLAASADGTTLAAVWNANKGGTQIVQAATTASGGATWGDPVDLSAAGGFATTADVTVSGDGTTMSAAWSRSDGSDYIVQSRTSTNSGDTWETAKNLSQTGYNAYVSQVVSSTDGTKQTAIWGRGEYVQSSSTADSGANWDTPTDVSGPSTGRAPSTLTRIAASADGIKLVAVWSRSDGSNQIAQTATSGDAGATWETPVDLSESGRKAALPRVTSSTDGTRLAAIWYRSDGTHDIAQSATSSDGGATWETPVNLSSPGQSASDLEMASSADGTVLAAVWYRNGFVQGSVGITTFPGPLTFTSGAFPSATVGQPADMTVTVTNTGTADATPSSITPAGTGVSVTGGTCAAGTPIPASGTCTVGLAWTPAAAGSLTGASLTIAYPGGAAASNALALTGKADVSPAHTVTFNANGGTGSMTDQSANVPTALSANTFTRTGYTFTGWNTTAGGAGTSYADNATYPFSTDTTLYAQWSSISPQPPGKVPGVKAKVRKGKATITWKATTGADSYRVRISKPGGKKYKAAKIVRSMKFKAKVKKGKKYRFQIAAVGPAGNGPTTTIRFKGK